MIYIVIRISFIGYVSVLRGFLRRINYENEKKEGF